MQWSEFSHSIRHLSPGAQATVQKAYGLAKEAHKDQTRKSGEPFFTHPIAVATILADMGADEETLCAALLHDTVEDTPVTLAQVKKDFGPAIGDLVDGVTKLNKEHVANKPTLDEKIETLRKMFTLMQKDIRIIVIKLADRLHNIQTTDYLESKKKERLAEETILVYAKIAEQLCMRTVRLEIEKYCLEILNPQKFAKMDKRRKQNNELAKKLIPIIKKELDTSFHTLMKTVELIPEQKKWRDLESQIEAEGAATGISDVTIDFVCDSIDDCYRTIGALHQLWQRENLSFQDYINAPMLNGYKGVHTTVILPSGDRVRCKIRTKEMHKYAFKGITTICFEEHTDDNNGALPWTLNIASVTEDTKNRSEDFWESLQNDILGDNIIIHGPDDRTALIPGGSTALDGAFYLFGDLALRTKEIVLNGKIVPFGTKLRVADSLTIAMGRERIAEHRWLDSVMSGLATAKIRAFLRTQSTTKKVQLARKLLQENMKKKRGGYLEEFNQETLDSKVRSLGFSSLKDAYIAIAEGELEIGNLYATLFESKQKQRDRCYDMHLEITEKNLKHVLEILQLNFDIRKLRVSKKRSAKSYIVHATSCMSKAQYPALIDRLKSAGALTVKLESQRNRNMRILLCSTLMVVWGVDPVFAQNILQMGVSPESFTLIRLIAVFGTSLAVLLLSRIYYKHSFIPLNNPWLWIAGISLFGVGYLTYHTLVVSSPVLYNTVLRGNALLMAITVIGKRKGNISLYAISTIMLLGYLLIFLHEGFSRGLGLSLGVLVVFYLYSSSSNRFQDQFNVLARYPQFFFTTSFIALGASSLLLLSPSTLDISLSKTLLVSAYSILFIGMPYVTFYWLTRHYGYAKIAPWITLSLVITFIYQGAINGAASILPYIPAAILLIIGAIATTNYPRRI